MINLIEFTFTKGELQKIHSTHLSYILAAGHACNEINTFRSYQIFEDMRHFDQQPERSFVAIRQATLVRQIVSKAFEFNELTSKYLGSVKSHFPSFSKRQREAYAKIAKQIRSNRWVYLLRNKITFHYDSKHILEEFKKIKDRQKLTLIGGDRSFNVAHLFCEEAVLFPFIHENIDQDIERGLEKMIQFTNKISGDIIEFYIALTTEIFRQYGLLKDKKSICPADDSIKAEGESFIPLFVKFNS
jgi:hypothetical protein